MNFKEWLVFISVIIFFASASIIGAFYLGSDACEARWQKSTLKSKFLFKGGCLVEVAPDRWIPERNYREVVR